jgi:hypothetical protein
MGWSKVYSIKIKLTINRIFFVILRGALGVLLLSDVSFKSTYPGVFDFAVQSAGLSPMTTAIIDRTPNFNLTATSEFWWYFPALLSDTKRVAPVQSLVPCTGQDCESYFMPGSMPDVVLENGTSLPSGDSYPGAISYIVNDAPGFQFDFYPIDPATDPPMTMEDCRVYGVSEMAVNICLKQVNETSLMAGMPGTGNANRSLEFMSP